MVMVLGIQQAGDGRGNAEPAQLTSLCSTWLRVGAEGVANGMWC